MSVSNAGPDGVICFATLAEMKATPQILAILTIGRSSTPRVARIVGWWMDPMDEPPLVNALQLSEDMMFSRAPGEGGGAEGSSREVLALVLFTSQTRGSEFARVLLLYLASCPRFSCAGSVRVRTEVRKRSSVLV